MLKDDSTCRRLRPGIFLDGFATPCTMHPHAQLCDVCEAEASRAPPEGGPRRFPRDLLQHPLPSNDTKTIPIATPPATKTISKYPLQQLKPALANPINHPAPLASFGNHFAAAQATLKQVPPNYSKDYGLQLYLACQALAKSCVQCWASGVEYHLHGLVDCKLNKANEVHPEWKTWSKCL